MPRVKRGTIAHKRRKNVLKDTKGYRWGRKSKFRLAKQALQKAGAYAYRDRKAKKRTFRQLWNIRISASCKPLGISYSKLIAGLKKNQIEIDRKILAQLAQQQPEIFAKIVEKAKNE
ncbi:MAG: 50S ribosomal protein L20 [Candidatus Pacebacteria bacterium]|nr:50S ribosomal protein L20 [Candidatus Paceibacterota bacterium]